MTTMPETPAAEADETPVDSEYQRRREDLLKHGYRDIPEHRGIKVGARVRHGGHRWPEAYRRGSATVLAVLQKDPSPWANSYGRPDIEVLAALDNPTYGLVGQWADYHTAVVDAEEATDGR